jgi:hypothetical protein
LPGGPDQRDMVDPLRLKLVHGCSCSLIVVDITTPPERLFQFELRRS